jgi:hypothetical protein
MTSPGYLSLIALLSINVCRNLLSSSNAVEIIMHIRHDLASIKPKREASDY